MEEETENIIIGVIIGIIIVLLLIGGTNHIEYFDGGYRQIWR